MYPARRESVVLDRLALHLDAVAGSQRGEVAALGHDARLQEVLVKMVHVFEDAALGGGRHADIVNEGEMLDVLAKTDTTGVRADGDIELLGHQKNSENLVNTSDTASIDLTEIDGLSLEELLEDDTVLDVLAGGDTSAGIQGFANGSVAKDIIGRGGLLNEEGLEGQQILHPRDSLVHLPDLVGIHHEHAVVTNLFTDQSRAADILLAVTAHLLLEVGEALSLSFLAQSSDLVIAVT